MGAKKCYIATIIILGLLSIGLLCVLLYSLLKQKDSPIKTSDNDICNTKDCALTAATLIDNMDTSVNPCEDFYQFSCGGFIKNHPVPDEQMAFTVENKFFRNFQLQLSRLVEEWNSFGEPDVVFRMQEAYHVCINTTYQRQRELDAFKNFTRNNLHWPLMIGEDWKPRYENLTGYLEMYQRLGLHNPLVRMYTWKPDRMTSKPNIWLGPPSFISFWFRGSKKEDTDEEKVYEHTKLMLLKLLYLLGNDNEETMNRDIAEVVKLSLNLTTSSEDEVDQSAEKRNRSVDHEDEKNGESQNEEKNNDNEEDVMTFRKLNNITAWKINWMDVANAAMSNTPFNLDDKIEVSDLNYFKEVGKIVSRFKQKEDLMRVFVNLFGLEILFQGVIHHASPDIDRILDEYVSAISIYNADALIRKEYSKQPRWLYCVETIKKVFNLVLTRLFIKKYIDRNEKQSAEEMVRLVLKAYKQNIENSDWLDEKTKQAALKKANYIKQFVGYPEMIFDNDAIEIAYKDIPHVKATHLENYLMALKARANQYIPDADEATEELQKWKWDVSALEVNAFYDPFGNSIWLPFAQLQLPYFQDNRLAAVNFGMMGSIIGHEVGHAFDAEGSTFNEYGKIYDWWSNKTRQIYNQKTNCFIEQYSKYCPEFLQGQEKDEKICVNGQATVEENSADYTGLEASYLAYKSWIEEQGVEKRLPGLSEYTPEQIFFIAFGGSWCENVLPDRWTLIYGGGRHAAAQYRVIGAVSNSKNFKDVFNCPQGSMNSKENMCTLW